MANPIKIPAVVQKIIKHSDDVFTLRIESEKKTPKFKPGQFLHLALDSYDPCGGFWPDSRVFSIASEPSSSTLSIVYSVKGRFTTRMRDELCEGKNIWLKLPYGDFTIASYIQGSQDIVLIAGGTGISPYLSFLASHTDSLIHSNKIHLIYGMRKRVLFVGEDIIFKTVKTNPHFSCDFFFEELDTSFTHVKNVQFFKGRIDFNQIVKIYKDYSNPLFFLSGPPEMIKLFKQNLMQAGIQNLNIKIDEWE